MIKDGFKVLEVQFIAEGKQRSVSPFCSEISLIKYVLNCWVYPHLGQGPAAVFTNLEDARKFQEGYATHFRKLVVFKCKYKPSKFKGLFETIKDTLYKKVDRFPDGTDFARAVMITEVA